MAARLLCRFGVVVWRYAVLTVSKLDIEAS
jgi:hypothetical protein